MSNLKPRYPNSAGRLLAILENVKPNKPFISELGPLFFEEAPTKDAAQKALLSIRSLSQLHSIYAEFIKDLSEADIPDEEKNVLITGTASLVSMMYPTSADQNMRAVNAAEKALLEVCATRLPKENVIEPDDIENILQSIIELKQCVSDLPAGSILKTILLELIRLSEDSINRFNIYGAKGLKKAFKNMLAEVAEIYLQDDEEVSEIKKSNAWKKASEHLKIFDSVAAKAMKYKPLIEQASGYLLGVV
ncbi:MAG: hypothetical protein ACJAT7_003021 [Psychromonas sp.]|uniref:hypothetical protein n=1 Tax=Psychromonas sp. TaxID=1884585 RepID=UPI0039E626C7